MIRMIKRERERQRDEEGGSKILQTEIKVQYCIMMTMITLIFNKYQCCFVQICLLMSGNCTTSFGDKYSEFLQ